MTTAIVFLISFVLLCGCGGEPQPVDAERLHRREQFRDRIKEVLDEKYELEVPLATQEQLKRGSELYPKICASCHGGRGDGKGEIAAGILGKPANFTDSEQATFYSEQARLYIIRKGIEGTPMMGWENVLTEDDILAVYVYIRSLISSNKRGHN